MQKVKVLGLRGLKLEGFWLKNYALRFYLTAVKIVDIYTTFGRFPVNGHTFENKSIKGVMTAGAKFADTIS